MQKVHSKGFSLIELLVVIAIIGILSSVTLATLNVARAKGADAAIKADLDSLRKQASLYFDENSNYGPDAVDCTSGIFVDPVIANAIIHAETVSTATATCVSDDADPAAGTATSWAVSVPLKTDSTVSWCIDSSENVGLGVAENTTNPNVAECH